MNFQFSISRVEYSNTIPKAPVYSHTGLRVSHFPSGRENDSEYRCSFFRKTIRAYEESWDRRFNILCCCVERKNNNRVFSHITGKTIAPVIVDTVLFYIINGFLTNISYKLDREQVLFDAAKLSKC